jgi:protein SCO1/2
MIGYLTRCALIGAALVAIAPLAAAHREQPTPASPILSDTPRMAVIRRAPEFALLDVNGAPVQLAELRGRIVLIAFIFTGCKTACPLLSHRMARLQARLVEAGLSPRRVALVSITVDPGNDSAAVLARFAKTFDAGPGWLFLRETPHRLRPVLDAYNEWVTRLPTGEVDHPARLHLIDAAGRVREIYSLAFFDERQAFLDIRALEREVP